jgi:uncharacterized protein with PQ loop repeat
MRIGKKRMMPISPLVFVIIQRGCCCWVVFFERCQSLETKVGSRQESRRVLYHASCFLLRTHSWGSQAVPLLSANHSQAFQESRKDELEEKKDKVVERLGLEGKWGRRGYLKMYEGASKKKNLIGVK